MAFKSEPGRPQQTRGHAGKRLDLSWDNPDLDKTPGAKRDLKKLFLVFGLGALSWVATYVGMLELIEANMGELPLIHKVIIGFSVAMLMTMIVWLLDQMFSDIGWITRIIYTAGYIFLTVISVGFGFGFYWKVLESRGEASRSAESAVGQVQTSLHAAITRLEQLQGTLDSLTAISNQKADTERNTGLSCPNSKPGDGPRRKMREDDAARFKFASDFVKSRVETVKGDIAGLEGDLGKIASDDKSIVDQRSGTRNEFMKNLGRKLDMTVTGFNAFRTDPQLKQIRIDLNERADKVTFIDTKGGTYTCPDSQLTTALKGVVRAIDELPTMEKPKIATVEGSEAVIEAFRRLTATFYGALAFKMPPSPEELRELQKKAVQSVEAQPGQQARLSALADQAGLSKRDYVPLAIAIFVDICLLFVSMGQSRNRLQGLVPKMRAAERGPVIQILARFNEIHRDAEIRENFEMFRHVVFDFHGDYYAAIPLNAPYRPNPHNGNQRQGYGVSDAHALLQEAHLLANLFASFEKEKIFTRVHSPLLSTKTIQKRLRRQGSKFANSEAFRIYRFKDGAWSEIILGAVMGAARRVEEEKRRRRVEEDIFQTATDEPAFEHEHVARKREPLESRDQDLADAAISRPEPYPYRHGAPVNDYTTPQQRAERDHRPLPTGQPGPGYANGHTFAPVPPAPQATPAAMTGTHGAAHWSSSQQVRHGGSEPMRGPEAANGWAGGQPPPLQPFYPAGQGAAALRAPLQAAARQPLPDLEPAPGAQPAANSNTAPAMRAAPQARLAGEAAADGGPMAENVVLHPALSRPAAGTAGQHHGPEAATVQDLEQIDAREQPEALVASEPAEKTVTVEAVRETVTYKVPVSEAHLPQSLLRAAAVEQAGLDETAQPPRRAMPPPLPELPPPAVQSEIIMLPETAPSHARKDDLPDPDEDVEAGWIERHDAGSSGHAPANDAANGEDTRTMALRLRPVKRDN